MSNQPPSDDDWVFDTDFATLDRSLRRELRLEAEEIENSVASSELRSRTFADVAREARNRGDVVLAATQRRTFQGQVAYASQNFVTVVSTSFEVDIQLGAVDYFRVVQRGQGVAGRAMEPGAGTFEMRLLERESPKERVEIGMRSREEVLLGNIPTVGQDHIIVIDDQRNEWILPSESIAFVIRHVNRRMDRR